LFQETFEVLLDRVRACVAVKDDLGEYMCKVTNSSNVTVTKVVNLWCKY